jgi:hypothetical protein
MPASLPKTVASEKDQDSEKKSAALTLQTPGLVAHHSAAVVKLELAALGEQILHPVSPSLDARLGSGQR